MNPIPSDFLYDSVFLVSSEMSLRGVRNMSVVIKGVGHIMVHVPDFVRYGSKPFRDISQTEGLLEQIRSRLRSYEEAARYAPHQVFIGNMDPDELHQIPNPWYDPLLPDAKRQGPFGELMPEEEFYA